MCKSKFKQQLRINQLSSGCKPPTVNEILHKLGMDSELYKVIDKTMDNLKILNLTNNKIADIYY